MLQVEQSSRPRVLNRRSCGFMLIELLVVISIIALLISILLPALSAAKRRVRVLYCMAQLQQIGIGVHTYVTDNNYSYPPPFSLLTFVLWDSGAPGGTNPDQRPIWFEISGSQPVPILYCPLFKLHDPIERADDKWTKYYFKTMQSYEIGYALYLLMSEDFMNFAQSGNPDIDGDGEADGPYRPGDSDALIVGDRSWAHPPQCDLSIWDVCGTSHDEDEPRFGRDFIDGNYLFGDGHVVLRNDLKYKIVRYDNDMFLY